MRTALIALNAHYMHTSLAARQLRAAASRENRDVSVFESHINQPYRKLLGQIAAMDADLYAFSCYIWNWELVRRLARALKKARPEARILVGGPEVAYRATPLLDQEEAIDYALSGEGEMSFPALISAVESGSGFEAVDGLTYRANGGIWENPIPVPVAAAHWVDPYEDGIEGLEERILYAETSRGCPYNCQYCLSSAEQGVRALSAEAAIRRLTALADRNAKLVKLVDRTFNYDGERANAIWRGLIAHRKETGARTRYHFEIGAHLIDGRSLEVLADAPDGLFQFEVGVQSSDAGVLAGIGRAAPFERIRDAVNDLRALGTIHLHTDLIAGLPGEDLSTFGRSFDDAYALGADMLQLGFLKLLHGSGLRKNADALGIVYEDDPPYEVLRTPSLSFDDLCLLKDVETALGWYGNSGRYKGAMRLLTRRESPFRVYVDLARYLRENGALDAECGEKTRARLLYDYAARKGDVGRFGALLRHDLLIAGRRRDLPDALTFIEDDERRALLRARYRPIRGQSAFEYGFDVEAYRLRGEIVDRPVTIVYDPPDFEILD